MNDYKYIFGKVLCNIRNKWGITQLQAAESLGVPKRTYESWETGDREPSDWLMEMIIDKAHKEFPKVNGTRSFEQLLEQFSTLSGFRDGTHDRYMVAFGVAVTLCQYGLITQDEFDILQSFAN